MDDKDATHAIEGSEKKRGPSRPRKVPPASVDTGPLLIGRNEAAQKLNVCPRHTYALERDPDFPPAINVGGVTKFESAGIHAYIRKKVAEAEKRLAAARAERGADKPPHAVTAEPAKRGPGRPKGSTSWPKKAAPAPA